MGWNSTVTLAAGPGKWKVNVTSENLGEKLTLQQQELQQLYAVPNKDLQIVIRELGGTHLFKKDFKLVPMWHVVTAKASQRQEFAPCGMALVTAKAFAFGKTMPCIHLPHDDKKMDG